MSVMRLKLALLHILSVLLSIGPVLTYFFLNMGKYTKTVPETVKLCAGGGLLLVIVIIKVLGKLRIPSGVVLYGIVFLLTYLLNAIIEDIMIFALLALLGELLAMICNAVIKAKAKKFEREKTASKTAEEIEKIMQGANGRV